MLQTLKNNGSRENKDYDLLSSFCSHTILHFILKLMFLKITFSLQGSGRAADIMAYAYQNAVISDEDEFNKEG